MKKLVFLLSFLLTFSVFAEDRESTKGESYYSEDPSKDCNLQRSSIRSVLQTMNDIIVKENFLRSEKDTHRDDKTNYFPQVGRLDHGNGLWGSGSFVGIKENGVIQRNKIVTAAHNFFNDETGEYSQSLESYSFDLGPDSNNPQLSFSIKKIECTGRGQKKRPVYEDICIVTLNEDLPSYLNFNGKRKKVDPLTPWNEKYHTQQKAINDALIFYSVGYHGAYENSSHIRRYNVCDKPDYGKYIKSIATDCNSSSGMSGGPIIATKKNKDGSYSDVFLGVVSGIGLEKSNNVGAPYLPNQIKNKIEITRANQGKYLRQVASN